MIKESLKNKVSKLVSQNSNYFLKMKSRGFARMGDISITVGDLFAYGKTSTIKIRP